LAMQDESKDKWLRVDLSAAPELSDALANFMEEIGAAGVYQEAIPPVSYNPSPEFTEEAVYESLTAYLPLDKKDEVIAALRDYLDGLEQIFPEVAKPAFRTSDITAPDWGEEWKKYFHPLRIGQRFIVKPTWEPYSPLPEDIVIEIDPGMAFGTGQHHSTAMCLQAMEQIFPPADGATWAVLDVGTGTGILGIAAAKLGAREVVGLDIDAQALAIARTNALLNRVDDKLAITDETLSCLKGPFQLILANLTAKPLRELAGELVSRLAPAGYLIISGLIEQNSAEIEACYLRPPLRLGQKIQREEWLCYVFCKE